MVVYDTNTGKYGPYFIVNQAGDLGPYFHRIVYSIFTAQVRSSYISVFTAYFFTVYRISYIRYLQFDFAVQIDLDKEKKLLNKIKYLLLNFDVEVDLK